MPLYYDLVQSDSNLNAYQACNQNENQVTQDGKRILLQVAEK